MKDTNIIIATEMKHFVKAKELFLKYAQSLDFNLCFQNFDEELKNLPGEYSYPDGCILLAQINGNIMGCVAMRKFEEGICEMKRMYVLEEYRGLGAGKKLAINIINTAKKLGYKKMRLDTINTMTEAINLYKSLGFKEIPFYRFNPVEGVIYMELDLYLPLFSKVR